MFPHTLVVWRMNICIFLPLPHLSSLPFILGTWHGTFGLKVSGTPVLLGCTLFPCTPWGLGTHRAARLTLNDRLLSVTLKTPELAQVDENARVHVPTVTSHNREVKVYVFRSLHWGQEA
jgi:hypothetical protein